MAVQKINGYGDECIKEVFASNFVERGDVGAAFCVYHQGEVIVSLWAGTASANQSWCEDTAVNIYSAGKGLLAMAVQRLLADGVVADETPIGVYIDNLLPEVAKVTIGELLNHQSGVVAFDRPIAPEDLYSYDSMLEHIAKQGPWPGLNGGLVYSPFIWGWLVYQLLNATGYLSSVKEFYSEKPNVYAELVANTSKLAPLRDHDFKSLISPKGSELTRAAFLNPITQIVKANSEQWRRAIIPGANAVASARSLAAAYNGALQANLTPQQPLLRAECKVLHTNLAMQGGFMRPQGASDTMFGTYSNGFGHSGMGGSFGFFDDKHQLAVAYVTRSLGQSMFLDTRGVALIDALFKILEIDPYE